MVEQEAYYSKGQCMMKSKPYAHILCETHRGKLCDNCLHAADQADSLHRCSGCAVHYYCNISCQKSDWKFHKAECKHFKVLGGRVPTDSVRLFYRLMLRRKWGDNTK